MSSRNPLSASSSRGFSLVELLVVMAVLVVMLSLAGPAMNALKGANDVNQAAADLSGLLEQARAYAMANNTFTYVGLYQANQDNAYQVKVAVFAAKDGTRDTSDANLQQISRVKTLENAKLTTIDPYTNNARPDTNVETSDSFNSGLSLSTGGSSNKITYDKVLRFGPNGLTQADNLNSTTTADNPKGYYELGLKQTRGQNDSLPNANSAVIQVSGLTGAVQTYRP
jgi:prepilin-type N-terminal cleavage/methylation domain-containing protein